MTGVATYRGQGTAGTTTTGSNIGSGLMTWPAGVAAGDLLTLVCLSRGPTGGSGFTLSGVTGWTKAWEYGLGSYLKIALFWKITSVGSGETMPTVTGISALQALACPYAYYSSTADAFDPVNPFDGASAVVLAESDASL